jgi:hypothetical protein
MAARYEGTKLHKSIQKLGIQLQTPCIQIPKLGHARIMHEAPRQTDRGVHKIWRWVEPVVVVVVAPQKVKKNWVKFQQTRH